ncbi:hypothetical protein A2239_02300 [Candidatus Uhrbacteria bacterium RIFOXYA2_FULL_40_9]|nr:MAG: hypothetical protein A2239_02300 [Candidatus Uhrbacteria bacterium RIFOXYA2_FULL_40_9]HBK34817.1 hypothetical protein [Candidatus Uhrbacteria bacterium]HCB55675.1 hypothetical protein [Candidatus Uhrbacteria bacterium]
MIMTDHISSDATDIYLHEVVRALKLGFANFPEDAIPIFDAKGAMLWPKKLSTKEVLNLVATKR